jgi:hypothetical protein
VFSILYFHGPCRTDWKGPVEVSDDFSGGPGSFLPRSFDVRKLDTYVGWQQVGTDDEVIKGNVVWDGLSRECLSRFIWSP